METPKKLTLEMMHHTFEADSEGGGHVFYSREGVMMLRGEGPVLLRLFRSSSPLLIEDYRLGIVRRGRLRSRVNLMEREATPGMIVFITPGSIAEPVEVSENFVIEGIGMSSEVFHTVCRHAVPQLFNGQIKNGWHQLETDGANLVCELFHTLWHALHAESCGWEVRHSLIAALIHFYNDQFSSAQPDAQTRRPAAHEIFDRFIYLVNNNVRTHHQLDFYASKMCITERYLGTIVRQVSGVTAKEWIDRALLTTAMVMLKHSNRQVTQISEELHFANPSFFCKYFKRLAGCTPQAYRDGENPSY